MTARLVPDCGNLNAVTEASFGMPRTEGTSALGYDAFGVKKEHRKPSNHAVIVATVVVPSEARGVPAVSRGRQTETDLFAIYPYNI